MPTSSKRPCRNPRCPKLNCAEHAYGATSSPRQRGYDAAWDREAREFLIANPVCVGYPRPGCGRKATQADHVKRKRDGGTEKQALCDRCHGRKSRDEQLGRVVEVARFGERRPSL